MMLREFLRHCDLPAIVRLRHTQARRAGAAKQSQKGYFHQELLENRPEIAF
jgi:hypothetical protein